MEDNFDPFEEPAVAEAAVFTWPEHDCNEDTARICTNGHVLSTRLCAGCDYRPTFCPDCGAKATHRCPVCQTGFGGLGFIRGRPAFERPSYCWGCGRALPWRQRELDAARDLADELDDLKPEERERLKAHLEDLLCDTPRTGVAVTVFKKLARKAGEEGAPILRKLATDLFCEAAKILLMP